MSPREEPRLVWNSPISRKNLKDNTKEKEKSEKIKVSFLTSLFSLALLKVRNKYTRDNGGADCTGNNRAHGVHKQVVVRIVFLSHFL